RSVNDRMILELQPMITHPETASSPAITRTSLPVDAVELPIILTASDGTEHSGRYRPSRSSAASDRDFGDCPAGGYSLRIPYVHFTSTQDTGCLFRCRRHRENVCPTRWRHKLLLTA